MLGIEESPLTGKFALFYLGFRPFFLGAALFSVTTMSWWMAVFIFGWQSRPLNISPATWHAHEMIFGYSIAVIAGFLLTAVKNWTGIQTPHRSSLALLFLLWLVGRVLPYFFQTVPVQLIAVIDNSFLGILFLVVALPVIRAKQWKQVGILSKILLMLASNVTFYLGVTGVVDKGVHWGLYSGLYLILSLVFVMGRRVIPFFIERGVDEPVQLTNRKWVDRSSLVLFIGFWIADAFVGDTNFTAVLAGILFLLHAVRLKDWYTSAMWRKPLLWVLYLAYTFLVLGFLLKAIVPVLGLSPLLATHAFTVGGIGLITLGMMSRVALGHTGRNIKEPPARLSWIFSLLLAGAVVRVIFPLFSASQYKLWIGFSQVLWVMAFALFLFVYLPILFQPRIDGRYG